MGCPGCDTNLTKEPPMTDESLNLRTLAAYRMPVKP
jgi:hypothetical protein